MKVLKLIRNEEGKGLVEYGLIISLVIIAAVGAVSAFGGALKVYYGDNILSKIKKNSPWNSKYITRQ